MALAAVTILPLTDLQEWSIRAMALPRIQILVAAGVIVVLCLFLAPRLRALALVVALGCLGYQAWKIFPCTPLASKEVRLAPSADDQLRLPAANVLMENREHGAGIEMIHRETPDVIFLMETDQVWVEALQAVLDGYRTVVARPQERQYGLVFATNLEVVDFRLLDLGDADKPTLYAELMDRKGSVFRFVGLHPAPPVPGQDTGARDAKTAYAARVARKSGVPVIIMGDFNAAAWSHMAQRFKRIGGYLDPRLERGPMPSFDATIPCSAFPATSSTSRRRWRWSSSGAARSARITSRCLRPLGSTRRWRPSSIPARSRSSRATRRKWPHSCKTTAQTSPSTSGASSGRSCPGGAPPRRRG